ncbi:DUF1266 domain-containing protein [Pseudomonas protegens]|jgi:hypothetical protein|uniref:DUF1266 domain-containing protein n=1 Tax=Pseudomonas protegens TaxID=380021 RepID=UPI00069F933F|nr:DUF1266 domain-containing protein [Pseudomonas protegens]AQT11438.1 hypothetical protein H78_04803 [Pseudomonas protegens]GED74841.1 hypothetical protein PFL02_16910 [Pseudomonas fluorescens]
MMTVIVVLFGAWLGWRHFRRPSGTSLVVFTPRKRWALTLAQPMVDATGMTGFYDPDTTHFMDQAKSTLRASLLHQIGFRSNATDDEICAHLNGTLERQWFRIDLHGLNPSDDPRAAMAFACVRSAFFVRCAMLMSWLEPETGWRIMLLNAQRAQDCFNDWEDFGKAFMLGRQQWIAAFRADSLGTSFNEAKLSQLLAPGSGVWASVDWKGLPALCPVAD